MSYTLDANVLLYASDESSPLQAQARKLLVKLAAGPEIAYLFWPVLMSYLRIATHPTIFGNPLNTDEAMSNVGALVGLPHVRCPGEEAGIWEIYNSIAANQSIRGNLVPDAHLFALMRQHGVETIWSQDRDFRRFDGIKVRTLTDLG
ncbi:type II toxin-antitoxin system VapC family toxin [soil metagenome]